MSIVSVKELLDNARKGSYAVGYFESWNFESLQGVIDAAEKTSSPMIIGFNGEFLSNDKRIISERISWHADLCKAAGKSASVPIGMLFNECSYDNKIREAIKAGFTQAMLDDSDASYEENISRVTDLTKFAHENGAIFEAEIGELPCGSSGKVKYQDCSFTDPQVASEFVEETGIDILAISAGNVHIMLDGEQSLDIKHIKELRKNIDIHFDLHGGTGISADSLKEAIALGVTKVCYGTYLKQAYLSAIRKALSNDNPNPHKLLGMGGDDDVMVAGRIAVCNAVLERIDVLGCSGKG